MRQQKTFLLLGVVLGTLMLSVAYASLQNITLEINGIATATPDQANFDVKFTNCYNPGFGDIKKATGTLTSDTTAKITFTGLKNVGDWDAMQFIILNNSTDINADVSYTLNYTNQEYFSVRSSFDNWNNLARS